MTGITSCRRSQDALIYSLAVTAYTNGLNVEDYFFRLLNSDGSVMPWNE